MDFDRCSDLGKINISRFWFELQCPSFEFLLPSSLCDRNKYFLNFILLFIRRNTPQSAIVASAGYQAVGLGYHIQIYYMCVCVCVCV